MVTRPKPIDDETKRHLAVFNFAQDMEQKLKDNSNKSGWDDMEINMIVERIHQEVAELQEYLTLYNHPQGDTDKVKAMRLEQMHDEAIDIANFCMFLCYNYPKDTHEE